MTGVLNSDPQAPTQVHLNKLINIFGITRKTHAG